MVYFQGNEKTKCAILELIFLYADTICCSKIDIIRTCTEKLIIFSFEQHSP